MPQVHLGHVFHVAGSPLVTEAVQSNSNGWPPPAPRSRTAPSRSYSWSGTMPWKRTVASGVNISSGTDFGGGDEWLIPRVLGDAFKQHITEPGDDGVSMHPAEMLFVGTLAGARALDMENRFGNFDTGKEADFLVIEPADALKGLLDSAYRAEDADLARDQTLFALLMGLRESSIAEVYVRGRRLNPLSNRG